MKLQNLTEKTIIALFIVIFGMSAVAFLDLKDTTENSFVNLMIMVVSFYFGSSAVKEQKEKWDNAKNNVQADDIGGGGIKNPPPPPEPEQ